MKKSIYSFLLLFTAYSLTGQVSIDRSNAPEAGPARTPKIAAYDSFELNNGLKVFVVEDHKLPRITMSLILDRDPIMEGNKAGYTSMAGDIIGSGTDSRTKAQLDEEIDFMGANFSSSASSIRAGGLSKYTDDILDIFSDVLLNPSFPEEEFKKLKSQMTSGVKANSENVDAISSNLTGVSIYGLEHPYGEVMTEATVDAITLEDCKSYYDAYFRPNIAYLVIIGDITVKEAKKKLGTSLKKWKRKEVPSLEYSKTPLPASSRIVLVDKPSAVQSLIWVGNVIDLAPGHPDIEPLRIANKILGGGMSGRLFRNLREDKAFTYGAYSNFGIDKLNSTFSASAKVRNEVTDSAIVEFMNELKTIRTEMVSQEDIVNAKSSLSGSFGRSLESTSSAATFALNIARYGLPKDYYNNYLNRLDDVTAEDVLRVSKKYITTDNITIAVVGKAQDIAGKLSAFGSIEYYDKFGQPSDEPEFLFTPDGVTLENIMDNYYEALGGLDQLKQLKAISQESSIEIPGAPQKLSVISAKIIPNKVLEEQTMGSMTLSKTLFTDGKAEKSGMRGSSTVEGAELEELSRQAKYVVEQVGWLDRLEEFHFDGQTLIDGKAVYQVSEFSNANEKPKKTHYFDTITGLFYQSMENQESPQGDISITSTVLEWQQVGGIKFEKTIETKAGPQTFTITVETIKLNDDVSSSLFK